MEDEGWKHINYVGKIVRVGLRPRDLKGTSKTKLNPFNQETYFISSHNELTPTKAHKLIRGHWNIENNLHWQKDYIYLEDRHTLRKGNAPQVFTLLKSVLIGIIKNQNHQSFTSTLQTFLFNPTLHKQFLTKFHIY